MADVTVTAANVRPLTKAVTRRATAGAALTGGQLVYIDGANGAKLADADAAASAAVRGIVVQSSVASGAEFDMIVFGPMAGFSGMTAGTDYYGSTTAGALAPIGDLTTGDYPCRVGYAESATVLFVNIEQVGAVL